MTKRRKPHKNSNATKLAHKKFRWFEQLAADPNISLLALRACLLVGSRCSLDSGGVAIIGQETLAGKLGVWRQQVNPALRQAIALGHLEAVRRGRNKPNGYRMVLKDEASEAAADVCDSQTTGRKDSQTSSRKDSQTSGVWKSQTDSPFFPPGALTEPPGRRERETSAYADEDPVAAGTLVEREAKAKADDERRERERQERLAREKREREERKAKALREAYEQGEFDARYSPERWSVVKYIDIGGEFFDAYLAGVAGKPIPGPEIMTN